MSIEFVFRPMTKWPRTQTPADKRKRNPFATTLDKTYRLLRYELAWLKVEGSVVQQLALDEAEIRLDGLLRAGVSPKFPGLILSFRSAKLGPMEYACDSCREWQANMRAICLTLERLRLIDLYGCTSRGEQYTGWRALPAPLLTAPPMTVEGAINFLASNCDSSPGEMIAKVEVFKSAVRRVSFKFHPDTNDQQERPEWKILQDAKLVLERHFAEAL